ncbi:hypothetical protein Lalb_Chr03g0036121 [Lupinus albus]|uniref:Uncharacterized protein n=1 Tax=Lupinus albus TaxID=3870 RepID=A0A6A4QUI7_LUPAL|nr:hypothetical protein Lalb_Chr03g0036121 [Lupinus albus]
MKIMKKLIGLNTKQHKITRILYPNIQFDNPLLILLQLLVNQKVMVHISVREEIRKTIKPIG